MCRIIALRSLFLITTFSCLNLAEGKFTFYSFGINKIIYYANTLIYQLTTFPKRNTLPHACMKSNHYNPLENLCSRSKQHTSQIKVVFIATFTSLSPKRRQCCHFKPRKTSPPACLLSYEIKKFFIMKENGLIVCFGIE